MKTLYILALVIVGIWSASDMWSSIAVDHLTDVHNALSIIAR